SSGLELAPLNSRRRAGPFNWGAAVLESRLVGMLLERSGPRAQGAGGEIFLFRDKFLVSESSGVSHNE
ncbi:MAG: hypothetical protein PVI53_20530, partial [Desulfobacteraceae bacterium]